MTYSFDITIKAAVLTATKGFIYIRTAGSDELSLQFNKAVSLKRISVNAWQQGSSPVQVADDVILRVIPLGSANQQIPMGKMGSVDGSASLSYNSRDNLQASKYQRGEYNTETIFGLLVNSIIVYFPELIDNTKDVYISVQVTAD